MQGGRSINVKENTDAQIKMRESLQLESGQNCSDTSQRWSKLLGAGFRSFAAASAGVGACALAFVYCEDEPGRRGAVATV